MTWISWLSDIPLYMRTTTSKSHFLMFVSQVQDRVWFCLRSKLKIFFFVKISELNLFIFIDMTDVCYLFSRAVCICMYVSLCMWEGYILYSLTVWSVFFDLKKK